MKTENLSLVPFKRDINELGEFRAMAHKRLISLERRLERNPALREQYVAFLAEYKKLGHMSEISDESSQKLSYYLPHHCVVKSGSLNTTIRVVFDAS